jgi:hypothetical protein
VQQHLGRQDGVQKVEVSLLDGKVEITPKDDGRIDPAHLLKATYDSGVSVAEMDMTARGRIVKDSSGGLALQVEPNQSFAIAPNEVLRRLEPLAGSSTLVTLRCQLYKKPVRKKKGNSSTALKLEILEIQKKE